MSKIVLPSGINLDDWVYHNEDGDKVIMNPDALLKELRARDLEVARVVLEGALKPFRSSAEYPNGMTKDAAERFIRALKVSHE